MLWLATQDQDDRDVLVPKDSYLAVRSLEVPCMIIKLLFLFNLFLVLVLCDLIEVFKLQHLLPRNTH